MNDELRTLLAKQAIRETAYRYCRALDRMDKPAAYAIWHADGTANYHGSFEGSGREFVDWVWKEHALMAGHSHQVTNLLAQLDDDGCHAVSEAYVMVTLRLRDESQEWTDMHVCARYLDRWSERSGRWALDHRDCVVDLQACHTPQPQSMEQAAVSTRDRSDLSWRLFPESP